MTTVIVMAKAPVPGRVKTRLCPPCTASEAALVAEAALRDTLDAVSRVGADRCVVVLDGIRPGWFPEDLESMPQCEGGLDVRLAQAFADVLSERSEPTVLVAMDTPHLDATHLQNALALLAAPDAREHRAVLGMADDGGYWMIGLNRADREVFVGVPMSEHGTGRAQRTRLEDRGYRVEVVPATFDIDTVADLDRLMHEHPDLRTSNVWRALRT